MGRKPSQEFLFFRQQVVIMVQEKIKKILTDNYEEFFYEEEYITWQTSVRAGQIRQCKNIKKMGGVLKQDKGFFTTWYPPFETRLYRFGLSPEQDSEDNCYLLQFNGPYSIIRQEKKSIKVVKVFPKNIIEEIADHSIVMLAEVLRRK